MQDLAEFTVLLFMKRLEPFYLSSKAVESIVSYFRLDLLKLVLQLCDSAVRIIHHFKILDIYESVFQ